MIKQVRSSADSLAEAEAEAEAGIWILNYPCVLLSAVQPLPKGDQVLNFSDAEDMIDDSKLK